LTSVNGGAPAVTCTYTWGDALLAQDQLTGTNWQASLPLHDAHGHLTDLSGNVTDSYDYDAFGNLIARAGSTPNNHLYTGEQFDPDLGLYYLRARYHNPVNYTKQSDSFAAGAAGETSRCP
jgi:RHS repeat-associated protein